MSENEQENTGLTDAAKASVLHTGLHTQLKRAVSPAKPVHDSDVQALKRDAQAMAETIQQLLNSGGLDDAVTQKLNAVLSRLKGALHGGHVSREALATALAEATSALSGAEAASKTASAITIEQLWLQVDAYNKEINDDFEKMRKAGIQFDEKLWHKHRQLSEYLADHPHSIKEQKELDAVDDELLLQAEPQLAKHPNAKEAFDDAKKKSHERHKVVDHDLNKAQQNMNDTSLINWDSPVADDKAGYGNKQLLTNVTMDDVSLQTVGQKPKPASKTLT